MSARKSNYLRWLAAFARGCVTLTCFSSAFPALTQEAIDADICIYGGTAAGVAAAVQAARMGRTAVIAEFGNHLGGMTSGGLGATDIGNKKAIGGIAREFYHRVAQRYASDEAWQFEKREEFSKRSAGRSPLGDLNAPDATLWAFEPHVAESILFGMINEAEVPIYFQQRLASVKKEALRITEIAMENGKTYRAKMFIDASYEGDLMAKAGVSFTTGREPNSTYGESLNGIRRDTPKHQFSLPVDPYLTPGDPGSGLLAFVQGGNAGIPGDGDNAVQAYNFRLCFTQIASNRLPHAPPPMYDPAKYELLARYLEQLVASGRTPKLREFWNPVWLPNGKTDINNNGGFSTDFIGGNYEYPNAGYAERARIWQAHEDYVRGFVYFLATNSRVPEKMRDEMQQWGPAKDEFMDTDNWPHQLYIREARRMISDFIMTEQNCRGASQAQDSVGLAAYTMDSHNCRRIVRDSHAENEGDVQVGGFPPYPISYRALIPKKGLCENLLVPVCLSASHIAYGSIRMEPVFMILGQSAATAAVFAIKSSKPIQEINYPQLRERLMKDGQILKWLREGSNKPTKNGVAADVSRR